MAGDDNTSGEDEESNRRKPSPEASIKKHIGPQLGEGSINSSIGRHNDASGLSRDNAIVIDDSDGEEEDGGERRKLQKQQPQRRRRATATTTDEKIRELLRLDSSDEGERCGLTPPLPRPTRVSAGSRFRPKR